MSSIGSPFSLEITIPEGDRGSEKSAESSTSRMRWPSGRSILGSSTHGGGGARNSSSSPTSSSYYRSTPTKKLSGDEA
jgi:hypothetical protein